MESVSMCGYLLYVSNVLSNDNKKLIKFFKLIDLTDLESLYLLISDELDRRKKWKV